MSAVVVDHETVVDIEYAAIVRGGGEAVDALFRDVNKTLEDIAEMVGTLGFRDVRCGHYTTVLLYTFLKVGRSMEVALKISVVAPVCAHLCL